MPKLIFTLLEYCLVLIVAIGLIMSLMLFFHISKQVIKEKILKILPDTTSGMLDNY
jgi:hypothetical protein